MSISKRTIFLILIFLLVLPLAVQAQDDLSLANVDVAIWPEFDKPSVLVIYQITLPAGVKYPYEMQIRIPAVSGVPNAVAAKQADGSLVNLTYNQETSGDWSTITFTATTPDVQLEYYDPSLTKEDKKRHFEYVWPGDYAVDNFRIEVQQPVGATEMHIIPALENSQVKNDGMTYYSSVIGPLNSGQSFSIDINYEKPMDALSVEGIPIESSSPLVTDENGKLTASKSIPWVLGILGILLLAVGGWWYWSSNRATVPEPQKKQHRRRKISPAPEVSEIEEEDAIYCPKCGKRASPNDNFCRACGARLRHP